VRESFYGASSDRPGLLLRFTRRGWDNPGAEPRPSVQYVEYRFVDGRIERSSRPELDGAALGAPQVLIDRVQSVSLAFLWRGQWVENLPGGVADALPQAVKLDMAVDGIGPVSQLFVVTGEPG
jgi:general secretion pathway protein J